MVNEAMPQQLNCVPSDQREERDRPLRVEIWGVVLLTVGLCLFLALISFSRTDTQGSDDVANLIGPVGVQVADIVLYSIGLSAFFFNAVLFYCGFALVFGKKLRLTWQETVGYAIAIPAGSVFLHLVFDAQQLLGHSPGGLFGELGAEISRSLLGSVGTTILTTASLVLAVTLIAETNPSILAKNVALRGGGAFRRAARRLVTLVLGWFKRIRATVATKLKLRAEKRQAVTGEEPVIESLDTAAGEKDSPDTSVQDTSDTSSKREQKPKDASKKQTKQSERKIAISDPHPKASQEQFQLELRGREIRGFELPSTSFLPAPNVNEGSCNKDRLKETAQRLEAALKEFHVDGAVTGITPGPVVTRFEYEPAPGVKLSKISSLAADLARVICAQSVRIVAPIPGKGVVGLEVPNENREIVYLREILEDDAFKKSHAKLPLAIGKEITGKPICADLAKMPHLLVAGATGAGKSVAVNAMVMSLLYHASPEDIRMIMVDPKMLELSIYDGIPHLLVPVVTDAQKAATVLRWAVEEMERRYAILSELKVRNIAGYNRELERLKHQPENLPECIPRDLNGEPILERMPFVIIVIDEFADLMMVASKDVEMCVARLAAKARAAGVHLILATQRPSVDVITGLIKANFPTRMSFRVFSRVDSRTVLDTQGAETLLGNGDMLFRPPGRGDLVRVHGAFVDEKDILKVVKHLKEQGEPDYREEIFLTAESDESVLDQEDTDEMYDDAIFLVTTDRKASISYVQRKLRVGYNRAARMIEMMERDGIVGPSDGRGTRDVLASAPPL